MLTEQYQIGDRVVMQMDAEARKWGRKGAPDGAVGIVENRYRYKRHYGYEQQRYHAPGLFEANGALIVRWIELPEGAKLADYVERLGGESLRLEDADEQTRRTDDFRSMTQDGRDAVRAAYHDEAKIGDLPETPFYPLDYVEIVNDDRDDVIYRVSSVDYFFKYDDGREEHLYQLHAFYRESGASAFSTARPASKLKLASRGNIFRQLAGKPLVFADLADETSFAETMGQTKDVRNPASGLYSWTKDEVLSAIRSGIVDGFTMPMVPFVNQRMISARVFEDRGLGERVRAATLAGFGVMA